MAALSSAERYIARSICKPACVSTVSRRWATAEPAPQTAKAERQLRRFWKTVSLEKQADGHFAVKLDSRTLRTPSGRPVVLPRRKAALASLVAHEWDSQHTVLKPHSLPLTSLTARALDGMQTAEERAAIIGKLRRYINTDAICYQADDPPGLVKLQHAHWTPLLAWVQQRFGCKMQVYSGLFGGRQPAEIHLRLEEVVHTFDAFKLAAFERAVLASKSYIIALAVIEGELSADSGAQCAHVEVQSQINRWGEVEDTHDVDHQDIRSRLGSAALSIIDVA